MRRKLTLFLLILLCTPLIARADDASKTAKIHEFFKVAKMDQLSSQITQRMIDQTKSGALQQSLGVSVTADQQQKLDQFTQKLGKIISDTLNWNDLEPQYTKLYSDAYTEQQIDDLLAFYKSPTGQVMVEKLPTLMQQANAITQQRMAAAMPQIQELLRQFMTPAAPAQPQPQK